MIDFKSSKSELIESVSIEPNDGDDAKLDILWNIIFTHQKWTIWLRIIRPKGTGRIIRGQVNRKVAGLMLGPPVFDRPIFYPDFRPIFSYIPKNEQESKKLFNSSLTPASLQ